jgi:hypothetical protein
MSIRNKLITAGCVATVALACAPWARPQVVGRDGIANPTNITAPQQLTGMPIDMYFAAGVYRGRTASQLTVTRTGAGATDLLSSSPANFNYQTFAANIARITPGKGLLVEEGRTNLLLNSTAPATQTTGSLANGTYTLWYNGAGTATMSSGTATGCGTSVASQGTAISFTTSGGAGTCVITVANAGASDRFQLELGAYPTSLIVTAGTTVARGSETAALTSPPTFGSSFSVFAAGTPTTPSGSGTNQSILTISSSIGQLATLFKNNGGAMALDLSGGTGGIFIPSGTWNQNVFGKLAASVIAGSQAAVFNGGTAATGSAATLPTTPTTVAIGTSFGIGSSWNGYVARIGLNPNLNLTTATLQSISSLTGFN